MTSSIQESAVNFTSQASGFSQTVPAQSEPRDESAFSSIQHTRLLDEDNEDNDPVVISGWKNIPISRLNFSTDSWSTRYARFAALTFEEELELYDLLEMDVEGDNDPEVRFDDTTQDILLTLRLLTCTSVNLQIQGFRLEAVVTALYVCKEWLLHRKKTLVQYDASR